MGTAIVQRIADREDCAVIAGVDIAAEAVDARYAFPVYPSVDELTEKADVIIDCSHHTAVIPLLAYCTAKHIPVVIATTGHTEEEIGAIRQASSRIPVLYSRNMSLGINLLLDLVQRAAAVLGEEYNVEIVEAHHNKKLDAPSGTARTLAEVVCEETGMDYNKDVMHGREGLVGARPQRQIGMHSMRGGDVVGDHTVMDATDGERIELTHKASSRMTFASGAVSSGSGSGSWRVASSRVSVGGLG